MRVSLNLSKFDSESKVTDYFVAFFFLTAKYKKNCILFSMLALTESALSQNWNSL